MLCGICFFFNVVFFQVLIPQTATFPQQLQDPLAYPGLNLGSQPDYHKMQHHFSACSYAHSLLSLAAHTQAPSERKPAAKQPGVDSAHESSAKPPLVKLIRGSAACSWGKHWSLALLFAALCSQWTLL